MKRFRCRLWVVLWLLAPSVMAADKPLVVSSIKPLQLLVNSIAGDVVDSRLLVPPAVSPHHFQLRPSDRLSLQRAEVVFWVGPALERFLARPLADNPRALALWSQPGTDTLGAAHDHGEDPHIWLGYDEVRRMAALICEALSTALPAHREHFERRTGLFLSAFASLDSEVARQLGPLRERPYLLMHNAYSRFELRYGLEHAAVLSSSPEQLPGLRRVAQLRERLQAGELVCVFREPQYQPSLLASLLQGVTVQVLEVDPLGASLADSADFLALYRGLAESFAACR